MTTTQLPSAETIRKFTAARTSTTMATHLAPVAKPGKPVALEKKTSEPYDLWIEVTPALAMQWLKNNYGNRPVKDDVVVAYARDMVHGVWVATHQGLAFDVDEKLIDGQHRLKAVVMANKTVKMKVSFNLPAKIEGSEMTTMDCVDRGRTRSVADQLTIQHGFKYGSLTASICGALSNICCGERTRRLSVGQTLEVYRAFEEQVKFVIEHRSKESGLKSAGVAAAFAFAMAAEDCMRNLEKEVQTMFFHLNRPAGDEERKFPVIALLHKFLTSDEAKLISRSLDRGLAEMTLQVIFLELHGRKVEKLEMSLEGADWFRAQQKARVSKIAGIFKLPKVEVLADGHHAAPPDQPNAEIKCAAPAPVPEEKSTRPKLDRILSCVEVYSKLSRFILTGRGSDGEIDAARSLFVTIARSYGYTEELVALTIRKNPNQAKEWNIPQAGWTKKFAAGVASIKSKL